MTWAEAILLMISAAAAGAINAVAGGGTLITFPALLLARTPSVIANATSTMALVLGTSGGVFGYRRQLGTVRVWLRRFVPVSLLGGLLGAMLLTATGEKVFSRLVPFLLLFATVLFLGQGAFRRFAGFADKPESTPHPHDRHVWIAVIFQFLVAVYGGYFGAGIGIMMLAVFSIFTDSSIHELNAVKAWLGIAINFVASGILITQGLVLPVQGLALALGALVGGFASARYSQRFDSEKLRICVVAIGVVMVVIFTYRTFA